MEIEGLSAAESLPILEYLYALSTNPDNIYRHSWRPGDIVCWDNRCAMHYGCTASLSAASSKPDATYAAAPISVPLGR